ncbi:amidohydrolase family protein [Draconibacterium sp. IB214405]|uniref:amidohydrolase family protein n=1 Tax=Draconibacterium sp. IB214405 TaxID=3097352 RepID=UPI002A0DED77|nr:amidohydrolase family protein [Draconibacterium sp. IB214405]MDX8341591.1 amidohydrolase family protein [Draconibacterium sp. IB214405]
MKKTVSLIFAVLFFVSAQAQSLSPVLGVGDERAEVYAFTNATVVADYQTVIKDAVMIIKKGKIVDVGKNVSVPKDALVIDLEGKYIYPSFIDLFTEYGISKKAQSASGPRSYFMRPQNFESPNGGPYYWNDAIKSYVSAVESFHVNDKDATDFRKAGFGTVLSQKQDGIMRGAATLVALLEGKETQAVLKGKAASGYSFDKGSSQMNYPSSLMGSFALLRQTFYDAEWYASNTDKSIYDASLEAVNENLMLPSVFQVRDKINLLDVAKLGTEFDIDFCMKGNGDEYQLLDDVAATGASVIVPLNFPEAPDVTDPYKAILVPLEDLKHWELAPYNAGRLAEADVNIAFTTDGLKDKKQFRTNLLKAIECGLSKEDALKALTEAPAKMIGCDDMLGSLESGKLANFLITSDEIFSSDCVIYENWVKGKKYIIADSKLPELIGDYTLALSNDESYTISIEGKPTSYSLKIKSGEDKSQSGKISVTENLISLSFPKDEEWTRLSGWIKDDVLAGTGILPNGKNITWKMTLDKAGEENADKKKDEEVAVPGKVIYPFVAYGNEVKPQYKDYIIKNATVWTMEDDGILENADVLVKDGKIAKVGKDLKAGNVWEIDGTGMHVTPGIIDEHSHMALNGTNEGSNAITSEVQMRDVLNPEDLTIYRQLAGGVTTSHLLHGSANPIGGQSVLIKLRWGATSDEIVVKDQVGFLKHALGENVKQSRMPVSSRFPLTRMGVEQSIKDVYTRAKEYQQKWDAYNALSESEKASAQAPRKDLQLDAIVDEFTGKSFMACHTYVQSETNMIMKLAQEFGIKPHTLIHNTEGYKVADKMAEAGAAGSVFADWWIYKYEVYDAITYNAALQHNEGVLVCINSDDQEMGRRLNQEAAKTVKYGGLSEIEAMELVTKNPAKILHLDDRMGTLKPGKDADMVLWTDHPLSVYAMPSKTFVDGIPYFDGEKDKEMYQSIQEERSRIVNKILAKGGGTKGGPGMKRAPMHVNDQYLYDDEDITGFTIDE